LVARVVSEGLRAKLGQPVIVENKPGGTGVVGARFQLDGRFARRHDRCAVRQSPVGQAENKNLKMLAVTSRYRLQALPNVPTIEESGVPGFNTTAWLGVMGPAALPPTIRQKLSTALVEIVRGGSV
jgi:tripartite-type tricarboxylate transporter receptor subunit TctC